MKSTRDYLMDMLDYIGYLETFMAEGRSALDQDVKTQLAIRKAYEVIGEIAKRLPDDLLARHPGVRWKDLKGFRDVLIHQYDDIDLDLLWAALEDLPNLKAAVEAMLAGLDAGDVSNNDR